jgi:hypothetical protein
MNENSIDGFELGKQTICHVLKTKDQYLLKNLRNKGLEFDKNERKELVERFEFRKPNKGQIRLLDEILIDIEVSNEQFNFNIKGCDYDIYKENGIQLTRKINFFKTKYPNYSIERINKLTAFNSSKKFVFIELAMNSTKKVNKRYNVDLTILNDKNYYRRGLILLKARMNFYKQVFPEFSENRLYCLVLFGYFSV